MGIYAASALRLVPFLPWLFGPLRNVLDVVGDAMLYLDGKGHLGRENIKMATRNRFRNSLLLTIEETPGRPVVVAAHSQGTVIAADVLAEKHWPNVCFVSLGSPIGSLYRRFLGENSVATPECPWLNMFRDGDYISGGRGLTSGGSGSPLCHDVPLGDGRHGGYFENRDVWKQILKWTSS